MAVLTNERGAISIGNEVVAKLIGMYINDAACYGIVGMAAKKASDGFYEMLNITNYNKGVIVTSPADGVVDIEMHIVVEYGTPIKVVADQAMETIRYHVEETTGLRVNRANIVVEGVRVGQ